MRPLHILTLEWCESPYHQGTVDIFLSFHSKSRVWSLSARPKHMAGRLARRKGQPDEDRRQVTIELLRESCKEGALDLDLISDPGPFDLSRKDVMRPRTGSAGERRRTEPSRAALEENELLETAPGRVRRGRKKSISAAERESRRQQAAHARALGFACDLARVLAADEAENR